MKYVYNQGSRNIYWLTCQLFFVIFLKVLGIKKVAFYDRKPLKLCLTEWHCIYNSGTESVKF
ncbi:MAG: hypothetical protein EGP96_18735 [Roseburia inulinivorans]|nr:hypothetical protein [Roseburia inulinivorans]